MRLEVVRLAEWSTEMVNDFPDSSFADVESGDRDSEGKTVPRSKRHLPYKDASGKVDAAHVRNALARLNQTDIPPDRKAKAKRILLAAAKTAGVQASEESYVDDYTPVMESTAIDLEQGIVRNVAFIRAGWTRNGERFYTKDALEAAVGLYDGVPQFSGHGSRDERDNKKERDLGDWLSNVIPGSVHFDAQQESIVGDSKLIKGHPGADTLARMLEDPLTRAKMGQSHKAYAVLKMGEREGRKGLIVEALKGVQSVDWVTAANSGGHTRNATLESEVEGVMEIGTLQELKEHYPGLLEQYRQEIVAPVEAKLHEADTRLADVVARLDRVDKEKKVTAFLDEAKVPAKMQGLVREGLLAVTHTSDEELKADCVSKASMCLEALKETAPKLGAGLSAPAATDDPDIRKSVGDLGKRVTERIFRVG